MFRSVFRHLQNVTSPTSLCGLAAMFFFLPFTLAQETRKPLTQAYSLADIGIDATTWVTRQGPDGVLYFGGNSLVSFDGARWRRFPVSGTGGLRGLDFGENGQLWAAAPNELGWYDQTPTGAWAYHSLTSKLPAEHRILGDAWNAFSEENGALFVYPEKILRWNGAAFKTWSFPGGRHLQGMRSGSDIYVHHAPTGLYVMDVDGPRLVIPASVLGSSMVLWIEQNAQGFLLANSQGLFTYQDGQLAAFAPEASEYVRRNRPTSAIRLPDGRLAVGTYQGGIALVTPNGALAQVITERDGLPTHTIISLFNDREKGLWVTSNAGIFRLTLDPSTTVFNPPVGLENQPVVQILRNGARLTVATAGRIAEMDPVTGDFHSMEILVGDVGELLSSPEGLLVAGSGGLKKIASGQMSVVLPISQSAFTVKPSRKWPGSFLVSDARSIHLVDPNGSSRILVHDLPDTVLSLAEDNQGRLWLGTSANALLTAPLTNSTAPIEAVSASAAFGLPDSSGPARVATSPDGTVLAFTDSGAWILGRDAARFVGVEKFPGWPVSAISTIFPDGTSWVVHPGAENRAASVARITIRNGRALWEPHSVEGLWQVGAPTCILAESTANGETHLWIGGTTGLIRSVVAHGPAAPIPNRPLLRTLARTADNEALQPVARPLPYSTHGITFEFAAPEFARRPALRMETRLDGVDQNWVPADASSHRDFTALRDGHYTFQVRTVAETGVASPATISRFEIMPPWWRTGNAILGALLALVPTFYGVYRWRVRLLRRHNVELEQKVLERTEQLEKASAAKTQFVANMSHDIRNPLNGIVGLALALEDTWLDVKQRELVATLRECTTYLSTLVDDVLDFASIEAGQVELRPGPFSPAELLRSIAMMFKIEAISSGAVLQVEADPRLPASYLGDAGRIQQVLVNFVTNALKYSGGPIKLSVAIPADAPEEIEFSVADEGPGISEEEQRLLFTKFSRLTGSQSKEITGTGLGLAACRLLAGMMSGSVGVHSSVGHGARFYLRLPLDIFPMPAADSPPAPMAVPLLPNCSVLLVEDTNYNAMAAAAVLAKFGLSCERANTGAEALQLFAEKRHNLVLLDRNLPDMDGTEVARRIRALEENGPRTIMLAVTAYCTVEDRALCLNAGMDAFVGKPLTPQKLRRVLTAAGRRHLAAASMHVSPDVASQGVDVSLLEYISDGTDQGLSRQIELFLIALGEAEKQLQQAARTTDFKLLAEAAHGVLSHARLVGSASLANAAATLQTAALAEDREAFNILHRVRREIDSLTAVVRRHPGAERTA